jgi:hypothetical protein
MDRARGVDGYSGCYIISMYLLPAFKNYMMLLYSYKYSKGDN